MNRVKNVIMEVTYFLNDPMFICYFIVILFLKRLLIRILTNTLATILPLNSKLSRKSLRFNAVDGSIKMLKYR